MALQITGKIAVIGATCTIQTSSQRPLYKRELVLDCTRYDRDTGEPWENYPKFEFVGDKCAILDQFQVGQRVVVDFSLSGRKYQDKTTGETKFFTSIVAFRVQDADATTSQPQTQWGGQQQSAAQPYQQPQEYQPAPQQSDDLPF